MLSPDYLETVADPIGELYDEFITAILVDIAERIKLAGEYDREELYDTAAYLNRKLRELGLQQEWINLKLAELLNKTQQEVEEIMSTSTAMSVESSFSLLNAAGYDTTGLSFIKQIQKSTRVLEGELTNLTRTTANLARDTLINAYDKAYLQVASGAYSYDQAVKLAIQELTKNGIGVITYESGARRTVESAVRLAVRTSVNQNALTCEEDMLNELGVNLVETSSHLGARPSHAEWQGKVFWRLHPEGDYDNFYEATGYGTGEGLGGYNCRHSFYPYFPEIGQTYKPYNQEENEELYKLSQEQRYHERKMREWDRKKQILEAGGLDTTAADNRIRQHAEAISETLKASNGKLKRDYSAEKGYQKKTINGTR